MMNKKVNGFGGLTHVLISVLLSFIVLILWNLGIINFQMTLILIPAMVLAKAGGALLPDLDNNESTAKYQMKLTGLGIHGLMVMTSSLVTGVLRGKKERVNTQHRKLWHAPITYILIGAAIYFLVNMPYSDTNLISIFKDKINIGWINWIIIAVFGVFLWEVALMSYNVLSYNNPVLKYIKYGLNAVVTGYLVYVFLTMNLSTWKILLLCVVIGCIDHIVGDFFSKGASPIFFPIPIKGRFWFCPSFPGQIETSGLGNNILDVFLGIIDFVLLVFIIYLEVT